MWERWERLAVQRGDPDETETVYSVEEFEQLVEIIGTEDWAHDRLQLATTEIARLCDRLAVDDDVVDEATGLYRLMIRTELVNNYSIGTLTTAAVYTVCREHGEPRTLDDVHDAAQVAVERDSESTSSRPRTVYRKGTVARKLSTQRVYRAVRTRFDRNSEPIGSAKFVERYCADLELDQAVEEVARVAITRTGEEALTGIAPSNIAAAAIYYACETLGRDVTQREIGYVAHCSTTTLGKTLSVIQDSIEPSAE